MSVGLPERSQRAMSSQLGIKSKSISDLGSLFTTSSRREIARREQAARRERAHQAQVDAQIIREQARDDYKRNLARIRATNMEKHQQQENSVEAHHRPPFAE